MTVQTETPQHPEMRNMERDKSKTQRVEPHETNDGPAQSEGSKPLKYNRRAEHSDTQVKARDNQ